MGWFRAYRKFGGRLALFALALQFYLSFAHIHPDDIYGPVGQVVVRCRDGQSACGGIVQRHSCRSAVVQR